MKVIKILKVIGLLLMAWAVVSYCNVLTLNTMENPIYPVWNLFQLL